MFIYSRLLQLLFYGIQTHCISPAPFQSAWSASIVFLSVCQDVVDLLANLMIRVVLLLVYLLLSEVILHLDALYAYRSTQKCRFLLISVRLKNNAQRLSSRHSDVFRVSQPNSYQTVRTCEPYTFCIMFKFEDKSKRFSPSLDQQFVVCVLVIEPVHLHLFLIIKSFMCMYISAYTQKQ